MATGVASWSQTASSNASSDSAVNWAEGQAPSSVNDSGRGMMSSVAKYRDDNAGSLTTGGTSTAYTLTTNQVFASLSAMSGHVVFFQAHTASGASPTLNVDSLGAKALKSVSGTALATGYLLEGGIYAATYSNSGSEWVVHGLPGALGTLASATITALSIGSSIAPLSSDSAALGSSSLMFSDLFLASGAVINFNNGDVTATHSANTLAFAGASSGYTFDALVTVTGALSASGNFAIATNKFTVEASSGNAVVAGTLAVTGALTANATAGVTAKNTAKAAVYFITDGSAVITIQGTAFNVTGVAVQSVGGQNGFRVTFTSALGGNYIIAANASEGATVQNFTVNAVTRNTTTFDFFVTKAGTGVVRNNLIIDLIFFEIT